MEQFARESKHPELAHGDLILFGFSGASSLVARMVSYVPERLVAAIEYAPGHFDPMGMDTVNLSEQALAVPQLIVANGADDRVGTARPYAYYAEYRRRGAPLTFVIQSRTPHCCVANVVPLALAWLHHVLRLRKPNKNGTLRLIDPNSGWLGSIGVEPGSVKAWNTKTWDVASARVERAAHSRQTPGENEIYIQRAAKNEDVPTSGTLVPAWLPSRDFAKLWLSFEQEPVHFVTPLE
jgi:hypothetical protein